jgi:hypothetical protein
MLRKMLFWGLALLALFFVGGYFLLFPPLPIPPEIARGLPSNFVEADREFSRRVSTTFRLPLRVNELTARLGEQGFVVNVETGNALFEKSKFPCTLVWMIHWEAVDDTVSGLASQYGGRCL